MTSYQRLRCYLQVIDQLINDYDVDVEQTAIIKYDGHLLTSRTRQATYIAHYNWTNDNYRRYRYRWNDDADDDDEDSDLLVNGVTALWLAALKGRLTAL